MPGLNHLLKDFEFVIPSIDADGFDITNLDCKGISVGNLGVTAPTGNSFNFDLSDATVSCTGHLKYSLLSGSLETSLKKTSVTSTVAITKDASGTANGAQNSGCKASLSFDTLKVAGVPVAWIGNALSGLITSKLCSSLDDLVNTNLTAAFKDIASKLDPEVHPFVPGEAPVAPPGMIDWRDVKLLGTLQEILPMIDVNGLVDKATGGTGAVSKDFKIQVANISSVIVDVIATLDEVKIFGLDTFKTFLPLAPHGPAEDDFAHSINNTFSAEEIGANATLSLFMTPGGMVKSPSYTVNVTIPITFHDPRIMVDMYVAVNESQVAQYMQLSELPDLGCDLMPLHQINMSSLDLSLSSVDLALVGAYPDLNLLAEQCVQVLEVLYEAPALEAFTYFFQSGPVRSMFDAFVADYIADLHDSDDCEGPVPIDVEVNELAIGTNAVASGSVEHVQSSATEEDVTLTASASADSFDVDVAFQWQNIRHWPEGEMSVGLVSPSFALQKLVAIFALETVEGVEIPTSVASSADDGCDASLGLASVNLSGNWIADLMNRTQSKWVPLLDLAGGGLACSVVVGLVNGKLNDTIASLADLAEPLLAPPAPIPSSPLPPGLVDWSDQSLVRWVDEQLDRTLGPSGMNGLVNKATGGTGTLPIPVLGSLVPPITLHVGSAANVTLTLLDAQIGGLDTFNAFDVLEPRMNGSALSTSIAMDRVEVIVDVMIDVTVAGAAGLSFSERASANITVTDAKFDLTALVGLNASDLMDMALGQVLANPSCALKSVLAANITELALSEGDIDVSVSDLSSSTLQTIIDQALETVEDLYEDAAKLALKNYLAGSAAIRVNEASTAMLAAARELSCPRPDPNPVEKLIVWSDSTYLGLFDAMISFAAPYVDAAVRALTDGTGTIRVGPIGTGTHDLGSFGILDLELVDMNISGLDTIDGDASSLYLLVPESDGTEKHPYALENHAEIGWDNRPLGLRAEISLEWKTNDWEYADDFIVDMSIWDLAASIGLDLEVDGAALNAMTLERVASKCSLVSVKKIEVDDDRTLVTLGNFSVDGTCLDCTGKMPTWDPESGDEDDLARMINETLKKYDRGVVNFVSTLINKVVANVTESCEPAPSPTPPVHHHHSKSQWAFAQDNPAAFGVIVALVFVLIAAVVCCIFVRRRRRRRRQRQQHEREQRRNDRNSLDELLDVSSKYSERTPDISDSKTADNVASDDAESEVSRKPSSEEGLCARMDAACRYDCLAFESVVPFWVRWGLPPVIVLLMGLLLWANTSLGAAVTAYVTILGQQERLPDLFEFTLKSSVSEMWNAGVYPLAMLIAGASGGWPYLKLFLMGVVWLMPRSKLDLRGRAKFLNILELTGKWSLIDNYVLVMMCVSFNFKLNQLDPAGGAQVVVEPGWGFYGFLIATVFSMSISHFMTYYHRQATGQYRMLDSDTSTMSLRNHRFKMDHVRFGKKRKKKMTSADVEVGAKGGEEESFSDSSRTVACTPCGQAFVAVLLVVAVGLLLLGSIITSFQFHFEGAIALILPEDSVKTDYSLLSLGEKLPETQINDWNVGVRSIQFVFYLFAFVLPIVQLGSLLVLWLKPLTIRSQFVIFVLMEVASSWSSLDVFIVSLIAALVEIRQFAAFIVGDKCDFLSPYLGPDFGYLLDGDDKCFDVTTYLLEGCWVLFGSVVLSTAIGTVIAHMCEHALLERMRESMAKIESPSASPARTLKTKKTATAGDSRTGLLDDVTSPTGGLSSGVVSDIIRNDSSSPSVSPSASPSLRSRRPRKVSMLVGALQNLGAVDVSGYGTTALSDLREPLLDA
eukprot:g973.t1